MQGSFDNDRILYRCFYCLLHYQYPSDIYNLNKAKQLYASHHLGVKNRSDLSSVHHISLNVEHLNVEFKLLKNTSHCGVALLKK